MKQTLCCEWGFGGRGEGGTAGGIAGWKRQGEGGTAGGIVGWKLGRHWGVENKIKRVVSIVRET